MQTTNLALRTLTTSYVFWKDETKMTTVSDYALPALPALAGNCALPDLVGSSAIPALVGSSAIPALVGNCALAAVVGNCALPTKTLPPLVGNCAWAVKVSVFVGHRVSPTLTSILSYSR
jgi:hypothetical protein